MTKFCVVQTVKAEKCVTPMGTGMSQCHPPVNKPLSTLFNDLSFPVCKSTSWAVQTILKKIIWAYSANKPAGDSYRQDTSVNCLITNETKRNERTEHCLLPTKKRCLQTQVTMLICNSCTDKGNYSHCAP